MDLTEILAFDVTPERDEILLLRKNGIYTLRVDGLELMSSGAHGSEEALAKAGCAQLTGHPCPRVLVGGLGFGYTLRAALDSLPADAEVTVCELLPSVLEWNRTLVGRLARDPLGDPRVRPVCSDVKEVLAHEDRLDAIVLDIDNGPWGFTLRSNDDLYSAAGIALMFDALAPGGVLAVWSSDESPDFAARLVAGGFDVAVETVPAQDGDKRMEHTIFVAAKP